MFTQSDRGAVLTYPVDVGVNVADLRCPACAVAPTQQAEPFLVMLQLVVRTWANRSGGRGPLSLGCFACRNPVSRKGL